MQKKAELKKSQSTWVKAFFCNSFADGRSRCSFSTGNAWSCGYRDDSNLYTCWFRKIIGRTCKFSSIGTGLKVIRKVFSNVCENKVERKADESFQG